MAPPQKLLEVAWQLHKDEEGDCSFKEYVAQDMLNFKHVLSILRITGRYYYNTPGSQRIALACRKVYPEFFEIIPASVTGYGYAWTLQVRKHIKTSEFGFIREYLQLVGTKL